MWGKTCNRASGTLSSESTSQILYVLEGGVSYFSTQYAIRNTQAQFLIGYAAASPANRYLRCQETELLIICDMVVMQPGMVSFF